MEIAVVNFPVIDLWTLLWLLFSTFFPKLFPQLRQFYSGIQQKQSHFQGRVFGVFPTCRSVASYTKLLAVHSSPFCMPVRDLSFLPVWLKAAHEATHLIGILLGIVALSLLFSSFFDRLWLPWEPPYSIVSAHVQQAGARA